MEILRLENIRKSFGDQEWQCPVKSVSLTVQTGEVVSVVGPSGTGKSTLLNVIGGLLRPDSGTVTICGEMLSEMTDEGLTALRGNRLGFIFQETHLIQALTVRENLEFVHSRQYTKKVDTARIDAMLETVGLTDRGGHLPCQLSVGQRRRAVAAAALIKEPSLILADEPTNDLDPFWANQVIELLRQAAERGAAVVMVTHHSEWAGAASRQYLLEHGSLNPV